MKNCLSLIQEYAKTNRSIVEKFDVKAIAMFCLLTMTIQETEMQAELCEWLKQKKYTFSSIQEKLWGNCRSSSSC